MVDNSEKKKKYDDTSDEGVMMQARMIICVGMYAQTAMHNTSIYKAFSCVLPFKNVVFGFN